MATMLAKASTCFVVFVIPAYALLCEEQLAHLNQKTKIVKEGDALVRFGVPQAIAPPVLHKSKL